MKCRPIRLGPVCPGPPHLLSWYILANQNFWCSPTPCQVHSHPPSFPPDLATVLFSPKLSIQPSHRVMLGIILSKAGLPSPPPLLWAVTTVRQKVSPQAQVGPLIVGSYNPCCSPSPLAGTGGGSVSSEWSLFLLNFPWSQLSYIW